MPPTPPPPRCLTIGGSDSGGAAGIQADLRTWAVLGVYGLSAITAVTAQNSLQVTRAQFMVPDLVAAQMNAVLGDYGATAVKTGFLGQVPIIETIADTLRQDRPPFLVIDPVLVNHRRAAMFPEAVTTAYRQHLMPLAALVTPNWAEAQVLVPDTASPTAVLAKLHQMGAQNVLIKSVPANGRFYDWFSDGQTSQQWSQDRIQTDNTHGSGDTLSAAICAFVAQGASLATAVGLARTFTRQAIANGADWQLGEGHGPVWPL